MTEEQKAEYIAALIREAEGYRRSDDKAALEGVEAELRRIRGEAKPPQKRAQTRVARGSTR